MSIPLYMLAALMRDDREAQEAGLKYILLGGHVLGDPPLWHPS